MLKKEDVLASMTQEDDKREGILNKLAEDIREELEDNELESFMKILSKVFKSKIEVLHNAK